MNVPTNYIVSDSSVHSYQGHNSRNNNMIGLPMIAREEIPMLKFLR